MEKRFEAREMLKIFRKSYSTFKMLFSNTEAMIIFGNLALSTCSYPYESICFNPAPGGCGIKSRRPAGNRQKFIIKKKKLEKSLNKANVI